MTLSSDQKPFDFGPTTLQTKNATNRQRLGSKIIDSDPIKCVQYSQGENADIGTNGT